MFRLAEWQLALISIGYISLLFLLAYAGEKRRVDFSHRARRWVYALSLAVYCSSWSFLGTSAQAAQHPLAHLPIYVGPILIFTLGWPFLQRLIRVSHRLHLTSIADLIAARFGKSQPLAIAVTLVAVIGTMPYIALQIKAIVDSWATVAPLSLSGGQAALVAVASLALFTVIFGIRNISVTERHPGLMLAIAFESLLKLGAFIVIGLLAMTLLTGGTDAALPATHWQQQLSEVDYLGYLPSFFASLAIVCAAFVCLPRQFHVMVVENRSIRDTPLSRWVFPLYLCVFAVMAIPIGLAGRTLLGEQAVSDSYVLLLPALYGSEYTTVLAFLGGISAASSMAIVSAIALATMISNEAFLPMLMTRANDKRKETFDQFHSRLLLLRRLLIVAVLMLGYVCYRFAPPQTLAAMGETAFGALAQLAPALIAAFYWRRATRHGVLLGLLIGSSAWFLMVAIPALTGSAISEQVAFDVISPLSSATLVSLCLNLIGLIVGSWLTRPNVIERIQMEFFRERQSIDSSAIRPRHQVTIQEMQLLSARFIGAERAHDAFEQLNERYRRYPVQKLSQDKLLSFTEHLLASVVGASSARLLLASALDGREMMLEDVAQFVERASSERLEFSQALLQSALENTSEGISVIDAELRLVAWNQRYLELFDYPAELIRVGTPIAELIRYNATRGLCGKGDPAVLVAKRITHLRRGNPHTSERRLADGSVIQIQGNPMPGGGFVMTFSDITAFRQAEEMLRRSNVALEHSVTEGSKALALANQELDRARRVAEQANRNKTRYMFACTHDLMQPMEAARLFASALRQQQAPEEQQQILQKLDSSLRSASDLLVDLAEVAKLESGRIKANVTTTSLADLLGSLEDQFQAMATQYQVRFACVSTSTWTHTDPRLLHRILQNLLTNAFRYAHGGKVLLGVRRSGEQITIQVWDSGPGIPVENQQKIFEPFTRLQTAPEHNGELAAAPGLGLGLSIAKGLAMLLDHRLSLTSAPGRGCCFTVTVPRLIPERAPAADAQLSNLTDVTGNSPFVGLQVLCVDNEPAVLQAMQALLSGWGCEVYTAANTEQALAHAANHTFDAMLVDYQLDAGETGLALMESVRNRLGRAIPGILVTADQRDEVRQQAQADGFYFMHKPLRPAKLRALFQQLERASA